MNKEILAEDVLTPPTPDRVAARVIVLSAVACRALIEKDADKPGAEQQRKDVVEWLTRIGVAGEIEQSEAALLSTPLGKLDKKTTVDATWSSEGMVASHGLLGTHPFQRFTKNVNPAT